jgi:transcriptional regulator of arginine metabolism
VTSASCGSSRFRTRRAARSTPFHADVTDPTPTLSRLLPTLYLGADGVGNLLVVKTLTGGAQPIAVAIDWEEWPEVVGSLAGDDTILLILRRPDQMPVVTARLEALAGLA